MRIDLLLSEEEKKAIQDLKRKATIPATDSHLLHVLIEKGIRSLQPFKAKKRVLSVQDF